MRPLKAVSFALEYLAIIVSLVDCLMTMNLYDEFQWRGMLHEGTPNLREALAEERLTGYIGFDPSAASLHVGSLVPVMGLARLQRFGHTPLAMSGWETGLDGDPT